MNTSEVRTDVIRQRSKYYSIIGFSVFLGISMLVILVFAKDHISSKRLAYEKAVVNSLSATASLLYETDLRNQLNEVVRSQLGFEYLAKVRIFDSYGDLISSQHGNAKQLTGFEYLASLYCGYETKQHRSVVFNASRTSQSNSGDGDQKAKSGDILIEFYQYGTYAEYIYVYAIFLVLWIISVALFSYFSLKQNINFDNILKNFLLSTGRVHESAPTFYLNSDYQQFLYKSILNSVEISSHLKIDAAEKTNKNMASLREEYDRVSALLNSAKSSHFTYRQYIIFTTSDMRNAIHGMMIDIEGMLSVQLNEYQEARCKRIKGSLVLLKSLISDSIDFVSDGFDGVSISGDPVDIYQLTENVMSYAKPIIGDVVLVHPVYDLSACNYAYLNKKLLHSIFSNVLISASKLLSSGSIGFKVSMEERADKQYLLSIIISGSGDMSGHERLIPSGFDHLIKSMRGSVQKAIGENTFSLKIVFEVNSHNRHSQQQLKSINIAKKHPLRIAIFHSEPKVLESIRSKFLMIDVAVDAFLDAPPSDQSYDVVIGYDLNSRKEAALKLKSISKFLVSIQDVFSESLADDSEGVVDLFLESSQSVYEIFDKLVRYSAYLNLDRIGVKGKPNMSGVSNPFAKLLDPSLSLVLEGYNILLIGSASFDRSAISDQLQIFGASVKNCNGISQASAAIATSRIDLVISDMDLEDGVANQVFELLNDHPINRGVPVIGLLSIDQNDSSKMLNAGFLSVFNKPFDIDQLINLVVRRVKKRPHFAVVQK